ncbi:hypothetical protein EKG37_18105 [Robertmurraya yapensis]|uniref:Ribbon-helix-helix protein, CopG family n=1 Tax=Bacillus yapensis TaxID=2492960 RepID=A0A3S0JS55_9BACI|nr:hypothetical protein [Bacillus yapensis]RTR27808.1 hypothetical protein EKG37_18105 [Bacillus yapensis]TKS94211.1 hypothetical protein FAR12_18115 [Bacillus yapensis]
MNSEVKVTIGVKVTPEYVKDIDTMVDFFQSRIELGKVTRSELLLKALDAFTERVADMPEYQDFLALRG